MHAATEVSERTLADTLDALARFTAAGPGVTRLAYDAAWQSAHRWLRERAASLGLASTFDAAGNLYFHDPAVKPGAQPAVFVGSHLDSVVHGGRFDGAYGTVTGLLVAAELRGAGRRPVVGFVTCEEEESRFRAHLMGARTVLGSVRAEELDAVVDAAGVSWRAALAEARAAGCAAPLAEGGAPFEPPFRPAVLIEPHIEQGPVLEREHKALGIVEHVAGYRRLVGRLRGEARHSGTTPMRMRRDALAAAAEMIGAAEALARELDDPAVATAGNVQPAPGLFNVVPGECDLWLEVRHPGAAALDTMEQELKRRCREIAGRRGVTVELEQASREEPTPLSSALVSEAMKLAGELGLSHRRMTSGAAHDAMEFARAGVPSLLVFVPSRGGISHSPDEFSAPEALFTGYRFVRELARRQAERE
ncbi:MAG TPA: Zn-dependent hydrolase [Candidatus Eisenbacteria bacterium]|jgi:allantoate deiminase